MRVHKVVMTANNLPLASFSTAQVVSMTSVPSGTLASWHKRKRLIALDIWTGGQGRPTRYSQSAVLALAVMRSLSVTGIFSGSNDGDQTLDAMIGHATRDWLRQRSKLGGMHVLSYPDGTVKLAYGPQLGTAAAPAGADINLSIDLDAICGRVLSQMDPFASREV